MSEHLLYQKFRNAAFVAGFVILWASSTWAAKSYSSEELYYLAQKSYYQLKRIPDKQQFRHHWEKVIQKFSRVMQRYPQSPEAYKATFTIAGLYQGLNGISKNPKDMDRALHFYKKVSRDFSPGTLTDDALFESAEIYRDRKDFSSATGIFKTIFEKFPKGDHARKARLQYQKLASFAQVPAIKKRPQPATKKPVMLSQEKKPLVEKKTVSLLPTRKPPKVVSQAKKSVPVKQILSTKPEIPTKKKIILQPQVTRQGKTAVQRRSEKKAIVASKAKSPAPAKEVFLKKSKKGKKGHLYAPPSSKAGTPLVVVDAGHGGKDHGAKSHHGRLHEKDVNLTIARHVKTILVNRFKYRVVMTRKDDTFIPLKKRSEIANNRNANLFVSIHANAAKRKSAHGIETYYLGETNNDRALETAARENGELVQSVKDDQVQAILASLITTTKINDSSRLAGTVQENLFRSSTKKFRESKNLGVKEGPFYVLHGADMPSILVEVGFLTNRKESRMLSKPAYLYGLASSIAEGIHKYLQDKEPSI